MAVRIDIPGIGVVDAENAASEDTLQAILTAIDSQASPSSKKAKTEKEAEDAAKGRAEADKKAAKVGKDFSVGWAAAADGAVKALKNIGLTAVSMAANFATNFSEIANNPIKETAKVLDTLIDGVAKTTTSLTDAIPVIGGFISAMINAGAEIAKMANKTFADQLQKNIDTLQAYNKVGVSFVGGMNQMNTVAHGAGLNLVEFSKIVSKSKNDLNVLGLSGGAAATALSNGLGLTAKLVGKSGQTLRTEMFKLGYSYEEQGEVMASYMASMKASGKLESMTREDLARGTRQYAADLKVVADFTGQDAKKLAERARQAQLNVAVQQNLDKDQRERLGKASQMLARMGPEGERAQQALTQMLLKGTTNIQGYTTGPGREMIETMMKNIKSGQEDVFQNTGRAMSKAQEQTSKDMTQGAIAAAKMFGATGEAQDGITSFQSGLFAMGKIGPEMISNMEHASNKQAETADKIADQTSALYAQTKAFEVLMETQVNKELGRYAKLLKDVNDLTMGNFAKFISGAANSDKDAARRAFKETVNPFSGMRWPGQKKETKEEKLERQKREQVPGFNIWAMADGGKLNAGDLAVTGERGPELISGPANVLSTANTESLIKALDAMREMAGARFGESGIGQQVSMSAGRIAKLKERTRGFEGYDYSQLQAEFMKRPESEPIKRAMKQMDDEENSNNSAEATQHLAEIARLMKQNVSHTARVAANTN